MLVPGSMPGVAAPQEQALSKADEVKAAESKLDDEASCLFANLSRLFLTFFNSGAVVIAARAATCADRLASATSVKVLVTVTVDPGTVVGRVTVRTSVTSPVGTCLRNISPSGKSFMVTYVVTVTVRPHDVVCGRPSIVAQKGSMMLLTAELFVGNMT